MKYYHTLPLCFLPTQVDFCVFTPHNGNIWLDTDKTKSYFGSDARSLYDDMVTLEIPLENLDPTKLTHRKEAWISKELNADYWQYFGEFSMSNVIIHYADY